MGALIRLSYTMNEARIAVADRPATTTPALVHPRCGPSMIAQTPSPTADTDMSSPTRSRRPGRGSEESGTRTRPASSARAAIGTFTRKIDPHQKCSSSRPPVTGPAATARPVTPDQMPIARARSRMSVKTLMMMASVAGKMRAAPTPMKALAPISCSALCESAARTDVSANTTSPSCRARRRPFRSPKYPNASSSAEKTNVYASTIHCRDDVEASSSVLSVGSATFTIVLSTTTMNRLRHSTASTHQRLFVSGGRVTVWVLMAFLL